MAPKKNPKMKKIASGCKSSMLFDNSLVPIDGLKRRGFAFVYKGNSLPGLTRDDGLLKPRFYPDFDQEKATMTGVDNGVPLKASFHIPLTGGGRGTMRQRMGRGMKRGNTLTRQIGQTVYYHHKYQIPLSVFSIVEKQKRVKPKKLTIKHIEKQFPTVPEIERKKLVTLLNSSCVHMPLVVQKLIELDIEPDGFEVGVVKPGVGVTALDLIGKITHKGKQYRTLMELKSGGDGYITNQHGQLKQPFQHLPNCVANHWLLQLAYGASWFPFSYPKDTLPMGPSILIRASKRGAFHYFLSKHFQPSSLPSLGVD